MTAPAPSLPRPQSRGLTLQDQALINLAGWLATTRFPDPNRSLILDQLRRLLPLASADHPLIGPLASAARAVVEHSDDPAAIELLRARLDLDEALAAVFWARGAQACAQLWPEENSQPGTEEPAHAAE
jgi:hypothetical protein